MRRNRFSSVLTLAAVTVAALALATSANAAIWTPADTTTALWFDAADASTVTSGGGGISQWDDKSGNARHATQGTGGNQPDYVLGQQNGLNVIRFNGSSEFFNLGTGLDWMASDASHVAFAVLNNSNYSNLYGAANGGQGDASLHVGFRDSGSYRINRWGNDYYPPITANYNAGEYNFLRWTWPEGGPKSVYANAKEEGTGGGGGGTGSGLSAMAGGGRIVNVVGQGYLDADLGELVFLQGTPTQDTIDTMEGYLAWKWGLEGNLPSGHPYEFAPPQGAVIPEPSTLLVWSLLAGLGIGVGWRRRSR